MCSCIRVSVFTSAHECERFLRKSASSPLGFAVSLLFWVLQSGCFSSPLGFALNCCLSSPLGFAVWLFLFSSGVCTQLLSLFPSGFCSLVLLWGLQSLLGFAVSLCFSLSFNLDRAHASGRTHSINLSLSHTHAHIHVSYKF